MKEDAAVRRDVSGVHDALTALTAQVDAAQRRTEQLLGAYRQAVDGRVRLGGLPAAKLRSDSLVLEGAPSRRLRVARVLSGNAVERPFFPWMGLTRSATRSPDVETRWERLLASERARPDAVLRGDASTILDVGAAVVSRADRSARIALLDPGLTWVGDFQRGRGGATHTAGVVALPRFTYIASPKKLRNFGHWLLDCVPQTLALSAVAPEARLLLPGPLTGFQRSTLALAGVADHRLVPWDGSPTACDRLLVFESTGRGATGRPLSSLMEMRRVLQGPAPPAAPRTRRIYVSRRDARKKRRWVCNDPDVEAVFASRGFDILVMSDCPLAEQARLFREARIVAGLSGAGLTDIVFSPPGAHVIVLLTDSLIRWYADEKASRSGWTHGQRASGDDLAALGDSPRFYAHLAALFSQVCHSFLSGDEVPIDTLTRFLDDVLERVESQ